MTTASAQRRGTDEDLRVILDSAAESIFHFTIYIGLMLAGWFPIWALFVCYAATCSFRTCACLDASAD